MNQNIINPADLNNFYYNYSGDREEPLPAIKGAFSYAYLINGIQLRKTMLGFGNIVEIECIGPKSHSLTLAPNSSHIVILFNFKDLVRIIAPNTNETILYSMQHQALVMTEGVQYKLSFSADGCYKLFHIELKLSYFNYLLDNPLDDHYFSEPQQTPFIINKIIKKINSCEYTGRMRTLFLETKVQETLIYQIQTYKSQNNSKPQTQPFSERDLKILYAAKKHIKQNYRQRLNEMNLAKKLGTNDHKLKWGFKELFGITQLAYLQKIRMKHACSMLRKKIHISEIADSVGYSEISNFSIAFKKYHGITPSDYMRNHGSLSL